MNKAWDITMGTPNIKVAVLDSGTDWTHPDLGTGSDSYQNIYCNQQENDWTNPCNPTTGNHIDDDSNGLIDDYKGWNFDLGSNDSRGSYYHGTFVAGIIGAKANNNLGVAGVAGGNNTSGVSIIPYCVGMSYPNSSVIDDAIIAAIDNGARVLQMSLTVGESSPIKAALLYAKSNDVVVVCASGNDSSSVSFPASDTTVVAVGATTTSNQRAFFSNYGSNLSIMAPGANIYGLDLSSSTDPYKTSSGTSFAAPQVSGIIALMLSVNPYLSRNEIINIIESTAQKVGGYSYSMHSGHPNGTWNNEMGYGLVNAYAAVQKALSAYIQGPDYVCDTTTYRLIRPSQTGETVTWSVNNGTLPYPHYSIVGPSNQDSVRVACEYVNIRGTNQASDFPDFTKKLSVTIANSSDNSSEVYTKTFHLPTGDVPEVSVSNTSMSWTLGTTRTFTVTNCTDVPDNKLVWEVKKTVIQFPSNYVTMSYYTGRTLTYTATGLIRPSSLLQVTVTNTQKDCDPKSITMNYMIVPHKKSLLTYQEGDILHVSVYDQEETQRTLAPFNDDSEYSLELWHNIYGRMCNQPIIRASELMDISGLPQGLYVLILKENGNIIAETKVQID